MNRFSILSRKAPLAPEPMPVLAESAPLAEVPREAIRFPGNDAGKSLAEMAQRDLEGALQLLAERAQYITGASGAAIALRDGTEIICRASAGTSAPELGAYLQMNSGLSGESMRTRQILRCDDAETDTRVNRESCRALGIASVVVMPLVQDEEVNGVFELFSGRANAFEERDIIALQRLAEMIQTAIQHSEASKRAERELTSEPEVAAPQAKLAVAPDPQPALAAAAPPAEVAAIELPPQVESESVNYAEQSAPPALANIRKCEVCGFPVSEERVLCLDCEKHQESDGSTGELGARPEFLSQFPAEESWISSHKYLIGIILMVIATLVALLRFR